MKKRKSSSKVMESRRKLYAKYGLEYLLTKNRRQLPSVNTLTASVSTKSDIQTSDTIPGSCYKKTIDDYRWKKTNESAASIAEVERKKTRIAIPYNKGAYQYITEETHLPSLGKKT